MFCKFEKKTSFGKITLRIPDDGAFNLISAARLVIQLFQINTSAKRILYFFLDHMGGGKSPYKLHFLTGGDTGLRGVIG